MNTGLTVYANIFRFFKLNQLLQATSMESITEVHVFSNYLILYSILLGLNDVFVEPLSVDC